MKKEVRGAAGETKAETATRDAGVAAAAATATPFTDTAPKKIYTAAEKRACSIEAIDLPPVAGRSK